MQEGKVLRRQDGVNVKPAVFQCSLHEAKDTVFMKRFKIAELLVFSLPFCKGVGLY